MLPDDFLSPENRPKLLVMSVLFALAVGMIVYNFSEKLLLAVATGIFLVVADILVLRMLTHKDDE